jgi:phage N-6-adenine-methyltransferase
MNRKLLSSDRQDYETPAEVFYPLHRVFHFDLDVCASRTNAKVQPFFCEVADGLKQDWAALGTTAWCNPEYGNGMALKWLRKSYQESLKGMTTVCLPAARPDTKYYQDYAFPFAQAICFVKGRIRFVGAKDVAMFPSALVVFSPAPVTDEQMAALQRFGHVVIPVRRQT